MIRVSKLTDYGIVLMTGFARNCEKPVHAARDLAVESRIPLPTVSKILKLLSQAELLVSHRGVKGGYSLSRPPQEISVAQIVTALEGPIAVTECSSTERGLCDLEPHCPVSHNWRVISHAVEDALGRVTLADLVSPVPLVAAKSGMRNLVPLSMISGRTQ